MGAYNQDNASKTNNFRHNRSNATCTQYLPVLVYKAIRFTFAINRGKDILSSLYSLYRKVVRICTHIIQSRAVKVKYHALGGIGVS